MHIGGPANPYEAEAPPGFEMTRKTHGPRPLPEISLLSFISQWNLELYGGHSLYSLYLFVFWIVQTHMCHMNVGKIMVAYRKHNTLSQISKGYECLCFRQRLYYGKAKCSLEDSLWTTYKEEQLLLSLGHYSSLNRVSFTPHTLSNFQHPWESALSLSKAFPSSP